MATTSNNVAVLGNHSACLVRATRLNNACVVQTGDSNGAVLTGLVTGTNTADEEVGARFEPKDACGKPSFVDEDPSYTKRRNLTLEFNLWSLEGVEILSDSTIVLGATGGTWAGKAVGINTPGIDTTIKPPIALEIWVKNALGSGPCNAAGTTPPYTRHLFPRAKLFMADYTYDANVHTLKFTGWSTANAAYVDPWGDWEGTGTGPSAATPWYFGYSAALPTVGTGGGLIAVPTGP